MRLRDCPLCELVENVSVADSGSGVELVSLVYGGQKAVALRLHAATPTPDTMQRAVDLLGNFNGTVKDIEVAGHWGIRVVAGDWSEAKSKSVARGE